MCGGSCGLDGEEESEDKAGTQAAGGRRHPCDRGCSPTTAGRRPLSCVTCAHYSTLGINAAVLSLTSASQPDGRRRWLSVHKWQEAGEMYECEHDAQRTSFGLIHIGKNWKG